VIETVTVVQTAVILMVAWTGFWIGHRAGFKAGVEHVVRQGLDILVEYIHAKQAEQPEDGSSVPPQEP
jgi:hypothetical protein